MSELLNRPLPLESMPSAGEILDQIADAFCAVDAEWRIRYVNRRAEELFERGRETLVGERVWDAFPNTRDKQARLDIARVIETQRPAVFDYHSDALNRWFTVRVFPSADGVNIYFNDITVEKHEEMAGRWLAGLVESSHDAIMGLNLDRKIMNWNRAAEQMFGYTAEEAIGQRIEFLAAPEFQAAQSAVIEKIKSGQVVANYETVRRAKNGARIDVAITIAPIRDDRQAIFGMTGIIRDVTEHKLALKRLYESHDQMNEILDTINDGYCTVDAEWRLTYVNKKMAELAGVPRHELIGKNVWDLLPHAVGSHPYQETLRAMRDRVPVQFERYSHLLKGWYEVNIYPSQDHLVAYFRDVTERKQAEATQTHFRTLFESAPGLYLVLEPNEFEIVAVSDAYLDAARISRERIMGEKLFSVFREDTDSTLGESARKLRASLERVKQNLRADVMRVQRFDIPHVQGDVGLEEHWWSSLNSPVLGPLGTLSYIIHRVEDVTPFIDAKRELGQEPEAFELLETRTQQMQAETSLRSKELEQLNTQLLVSQERLARALDAAQMGTWSMDLIQHTGEMDERAAAILGEPQGTPLHELSHEEKLERWVHLRDRAHLIECVRAGLDPNGSGHSEAQFRLNRAETERWVEIQAQTVFDEKGETRQAVRLEGTIVDITARRQASEALRQSEERYRTLFDSIDEGFCIIEMLFDDTGKPVDYRFLEINPVFSQQSGLVNAIGKRVRDMVPNLEDHWMETFGMVALTGDPQRYINKAEGLERWFEVYACRVGGAESRKVAVLFNDVTKRKQGDEEVRAARTELERRVEERTHELEELVENRKQLMQQLVNAQEEERRRITRELHDQLGQLLTALALGLKALHTQDRNDPGYDDAIKKLEALTRLTSETVQSLAYELRPTALDDLGLVMMLANYLEDWGAQHKIGVHYETAGFVADRLAANVEIAIYRIVQEALTNVLKHARATSVSVILERHDERVVTIIEDNGRGFDSEEMLLEKNVRDAFGLTSMRERAEMVGGALEIESKPNGGTTVFIHIPFSEANRNGDAL